MVWNILHGRIEPFICNEIVVRITNLVVTAWNVHLTEGFNRGKRNKEAIPTIGLADHILIVITDQTPRQMLYHQLCMDMLDDGIYSVRVCVCVDRSAYLNVQSNEFKTLCAFSLFHIVIVNFFFIHSCQLIFDERLDFISWDRSHRYLRELK